MFLRRGAAEESAPPREAGRSQAGIADPQRMKLRFQADWDLNGDIVTGVLRREPAIDFQTAFSAGLAGVGDTEVLTRSAAAARLLVTHDRRSIPVHFGLFLAHERVRES